MTFDLNRWVVDELHARSIGRTERVQSLWSGYGRIVRLEIDGFDAASSIIVKHIAPPREHTANARGWSSDLAHQRKLRSYDVETEWYHSWSRQCTEDCRVPKCYAAKEFDGGRVLILEDLDQSGFSGRHARLSESQLHRCLQWLACFHATFLNQPPGRLWPVGTYWHLATRPDEFAAMKKGPLKNAAAEIDRRLSECRFQSVVHGDAKVANFCFDDLRGEVAAVDFQYVGGGCGVKDVAYLLGSCLSDDELYVCHQELLDFYFNELHRQVDSSLADDLVTEWAELFSLAWADFHRFLDGWCSTHPKLTSFSDRMVKSALALL